MKNKKRIVKTLTWRLTATLTTGIIAFFVTGDWTFSLTIMGMETGIKMVVYWFHEYLWDKL